ncbi:TRAP transporter large permease subunit [Thermanaerosceptrum fracticalcis]|uniref:TRAP transporter large permease subunit n=1 Tax=Thermanaerosceptrum fracticalcis TaxID=1712410 RepID=A0A7G6E8N9_THEFR|nr:TRAP transporter large permease subunit [Thermanaerosceptrum fracticalcis]
MPAILGIALVVTMLLGVPIAIAIGVSTMAALMAGGIPTTFLAQGAFTSVDNFPLMAVPFFILAGTLMETGGLSQRIVNVASRLMGNVTGGLAIVTVMACMFFAAISGSGPATVAAIGGIIIPSMIKRGYGRDYAGAVASSGGSLGILIPPSIPMIVYGIVGNVSISSMFIAGIIPGILVGLALMLVSYIIARKRGYTGSGEKFSLAELGKAVWEAKWALFAPILILGGIYGGIFTPTESAVVAVVYGMIVGLFIYKELTWKDLPKCFINAALTVGAVMIILGTSTAFGRLITMYQVPQAVASLIGGISQNKYVVLMLVNFLFLITGTFMETLSQVIIFTPLLLPVVTSLGVDPIHFGILLVMGAEIGFLTPPLGVNLFVATGIAKVSLEEVSKAVIPFIIALFAVIVLITFVPQIALFLPQVLAK